MVFQEALEHYKKCITVFIDVTEKITLKRYKESYINVLTVRRSPVQ